MNVDKDIFMALAAAIAIVIWWAVRSVLCRLGHIERGKVDADQFDDFKATTLRRERFEDYMARAETDRREIRQEMKALGEEIGEIKKLLISRPPPEFFNHP